MKQLETARMILRPWQMEDAQAMYDFARSDKVGPMAGWKPHESIEETKEILKSFLQEDETWAMVLKKTGRPIGSMGLHHRTRDGVDAQWELGYVLAEEFWGKGLVPEAAQAAMEFAFCEREIPALTVAHFPFNLQSKRVIEKLGFSFCRHMEKSWSRYDGVILDEDVYRMTREQYDALSSGK